MIRVSSDLQLVYQKFYYVLLQRIKTFQILTDTIPLSMTWGINKIWKVCSLLTIFVYEKPLFHISADVADRIRTSVRESGSLESLASLLKVSLDIDLETVIPPSMEEVLEYISMLESQKNLNTQSQ
jgi:hypothetical protein